MSQKCIKAKNIKTVEKTSVIKIKTKETEYNSKAKKRFISNSQCRIRSNEINSKQHKNLRRLNFF